MQEERLMVCQPWYAEHAPNAVQDTCTECSGKVWIAPGALKVHERELTRIVCLLCASIIVERTGGWPG